MSSIEHDRFSYLRGYREIEPSVQYEKFRANVEYIGKIALGYRDTSYLQWPALDDYSIKPTNEMIGVANSVVYPANGLRVTQFERLAKSDESLNSAIKLTYTWLTTDSETAQKQNRRSLASSLLAGHKSGIQDDSRLVMRARNIKVSTKPQYALLGEEYALTVEPSSATEQLLAENQIIYNVINGTEFGAMLCQNYQPPQEIIIPFARIPNSVSENETKKFEDWVSDCLRVQPLVLVAGKIEWQPRVP